MKTQYPVEITQNPEPMESPRIVLTGPRTLRGLRALLEEPRAQKPESILQRWFRTQCLGIYENSGELNWRTKDAVIYQLDPLPMRSQHPACYEYSKMVVMRYFLEYCISLPIGQFLYLFKDNQCIK